MSELEEFYKIVDEEWEATCRENPLFATRAGNHVYNHLLPNKTQDFQIFIPDAEKFYDKLIKIDTSLFLEEDLLNYEIYKMRLDDNIERVRFKMYRMPISKAGGFHLNFPDMHLNTPLNTLDDFDKFIARLYAISEFINDTITMMRSAINEGQMPPKVTMKGVVQSLQDQITEKTEDSPYFKAFTIIPERVIKYKSDILSRAKTVIDEAVNPALKKFIDFLQSEYIPNTRDDIAISNIENGGPYYEQSIKHYTSLDLSAQEIHQIGLNEVKRIRAEMEEVIKSVNFEGSIKDFISFLRTDPQFYPKSAQELMEKTALVCKRIDGELPTLFKTLPRLPYGLKEIPAFAAPGNTAAYYSYGSGDGSKAGTYYVNTYKIESRPLFQVEALTLHESVPGHHLQLALQAELDLPNFRKFSGNTSFVEGWGLYSERLGLECGFYTDPYSNFGRLSYEMWRATRLVVDTGMHAMNWTRQEAIDFMVNNTSLSLLNIENEVDRYIAWPGQALAYKLGELKIRELRSLAEKELGDAFDVREFHDIVLKDGAVPLYILERKVKSWIEAIQAKI